MAEVRPSNNSHPSEKRIKTRPAAQPRVGPHLCPVSQSRELRQSGLLRPVGRSGVNVGEAVWEGPTDCLTGNLSVHQSLVSRVEPMPLDLAWIFELSF